MVAHPVEVRKNGFFAPETQTTTPLTAGSTWTSQSVLADEYASVAVFVFTDQDSAASGLVIQTSLDGETWASPSELTATVTGGTRYFRILTGASRYYRMTYTNGSVDQTTFTAYMKFSKTPLGKLSGTRPQIVDANTDVEFFRITNSFELDMAKGRVADHMIFRKFGSNGTVGTTEEMIWAQSGTFNGLLSTASAVRVAAGGDANDTAAGSGARTLTISGLDENFNEASETVTLAGTSASAATTTTFIRVFRAFVATCGTYTTSGLSGANTGAITVETTGGTTVAYIGAGIGQTQLGFYTVPANKTLFIRDMHFNVAGGKVATVRLFQRLNADDTSGDVYPRRLVSVWSEVDGMQDFTYEHSMSFPAKTDVWFTGQAASGTSIVDAEWFGVLVDD